MAVIVPSCFNVTGHLAAVHRMQLCNIRDDLRVTCFTWQPYSPLQQCHCVPDYLQASLYMTWPSDGMSMTVAA